jgi:hypothetical protein
MPAEIVGSQEAATPTAATTTGTPASPATGATTVTPDPALAKGGEDWEKRFKGVTGDLAKERKARQQYESDLKAARAEVEAEKRRVQALVGVNTPSAEEAELESIRARAGQALTPAWILKQLGLTQDEFDEIKESRKDRSRLADIEKHYWGKHGTAMVSDVSKALSKEYGGELSKRQLDTITKAYVLRAQQDPEFLDRHEAGDATLVEEFAKEWLEDWFEPAKRRATSTEANRFRPVPNGQGRSIVGDQGAKKVDPKDDKAVEDMLVAGFRERGGEFGRRGR